MRKIICENKHRYNVMLNKESAEKVGKVFKLAGLSLSSYLTVEVDEFAKIIDETGVSKKLDRMTASDALLIMSGLFKGVINERSKK